MHFMQYTRAEYGMIVQPRNQVSLSYRFRPDALLEPRDFGLLVTVYYTDEVNNAFPCFFS